MIDDFTPGELQANYTDFVELCKAKKLNPGAHRWLSAWTLWDLACSPMDDDDRRRIRYGHYLGFFARAD